ncbi:MAG: prepilin-type N-terminal cleavage/methylation domain-containing protein [Lachnospira sp.]|nr:prepilin-type N-terminal cleavage/methylation domain-containing protein [Lachnospira sp.]
MRGYENTNRQLNNKGFSLIELLVAVAVMAVLVGLAAYSVTLMNSGDPKRASKTISGEIASLRGNTLAVAGDWQYEIVNDGGTYKLYTYKNGQTQDYKSLGGRIKIYYKNKADGTETLIENNEKLIVKFAQGSGKVSGLYSAESVDLESATDVSGAGVTSVMATGYCTFKATSSGGGSAEDFKLYYETGTIVQD